MTPLSDHRNTKKIKYGLALALGLFISNSILYGQVLVLKNGDSLQLSAVYTGSFKTNEKQVTVRLKDNSTSTIPAEDFLYYFWRGKFYHSIIPNGESERIICNLEIAGPLGLAQSIDRFNNKTFYFIKNENYYSIEPYQFRIDELLVTLLDDFIEFRTVYQKKIFYDSKSLIELVSYYNNYREPEIFNIQNVDYEHDPKLSVFGTYNFNFFNDDRNSDQISQNHSFSSGLMLTNKYSPRISVQASIFYTNALASSSTQTIRINAISFDPALLFVVYRKEKNIIWIGPYLAAQFHFYSSIRQAGLPFNPRNISGVSVGGFLYLFAEVHERFNFFSKYGQYSLPVANNGAILIRGKLTNRVFQIGVAFNLF